MQLNNVTQEEYHKKLYLRYWAEPDKIEIESEGQLVYQKLVIFEETKIYVGKSLCKFRQNTELSKNSLSNI